MTKNINSGRPSRKEKEQRTSSSGKANKDIESNGGSPSVTDPLKTAALKKKIDIQKIDVKKSINKDPI